MGISQTNYSSKKDFLVPFIVKPNEATYMGEYIAVNLGGNFLGASIGGAYFIVDDKSNRDIEFARTNYPNIEFSKISNSVPKTDEIGCPLLRSSRLNR